MELLWGLKGIVHLSIDPSLKYAELIMNSFIFYFIQSLIGPQTTYLSLMQGGPLPCQLLIDVVKSPKDFRSLV